MDRVSAPGQSAQHRASVGEVGRLGDDVAIKLDGGVRRDDQRLTIGCDCVDLVERDPSNVRNRLLTQERRLVNIRGDHLKPQAELLE